MSSFAGRVIVYGGKGALGSTIVTRFLAAGWWVGSIDMGSNDKANANIVVTPSESWLEQESTVLTRVKDILLHEKLDAVVCVAGGWAGGNASSKDFVRNADLMWKQSLWTSAISAKIASDFLKVGGLLTLTGAKAALEGTPGMIGYGMAKAAVHHLVKSLADPNGGLPDNARAIGILPVTLNTPMNQKFMPKADTTTWTPLDFVADLIFKWVCDTASQPKNGSLVQLITEKSNTECVVYEVFHDANSDIVNK